jgi:cytoskeletal protein RodZ
MTARHQIRLGRRLGRDRSVIDAQPAPSLGEMLQAARERKGVDLYRAERDTKIRLKYLAALEDDALAELPPPVYTKGFIRNYALYLGLEPDDVIERWRDQLQVQRRQERVIVAPPPRPLAAPRRGPLITPGRIVAVMISLVVAAFLAFLGWQVLRFAAVPELAVTSPASLVIEVDAESYTLAGTAGPAARVSIAGPGNQTFTVIASSTDGTWSRSVPLSKGRNDFRIVASDAITERESDPVLVIITVPLPNVTSPPSPAGTPAPIQLTLTSPANGSTSTDGSVVVSGTTTGTRITIDTEFLGALSGEPSPEATTTPAPSPDGSPLPTTAPIGPVDITVPVGGSFSHTLSLGPGRWRLTVTAHATGLSARSDTRLVTVDDSAPPVGDGLHLILEARGGASWTRIVVDGETLRPRDWGGPTLRDGEAVEITAEREIFIRSGNAGNLHVTLNGRDLGPLGNRGQVGNWLIVPGSDPQPTSESR